MFCWRRRTILVSRKKVNFAYKTKVYVAVRIYKTRRWLSGSPLVILGQESECVEIHIVSVKFSDLFTSAGMQTQLDFVHTSLLSQGTIPVNVCEDFLRDVSTYVSLAACAARDRKPFDIGIPLDFEDVSDIYVNDHLQRVMQESMQQSSRPVPASASSIAALETTKFQQEGFIEACSICFDEFVKGVNTTRMPCTHEFHQECIITWLKMKNTCPLCRFAMPTS